MLSLMYHTIDNKLEMGNLKNQTVLGQNFGLKS